MKQYETYKDSGIEWLGKIPSHWTPISMKYYFYMKGRIGWQGLKADEFISDGPDLVTGTDFENGKVDWSRCYHISEERYAEAPEIHVKEGDLLITKDGTVGKLAYVDYVPGKVSLNSHLLILRPLTDSVSNHFMYWALQANNFVHYTGLAQSGSIMASLSQEKIGDYKLALPSLLEQRIIATYLDNKVSQIDTVIAEKEKMIEDLQNYRKSIISEAVTRGLNTDVPMKDSGFEWIGMIPESWKVTRLKFISDNFDGTHFSPETKEEGMPYITAGDVRGKGLDYDGAKKISYEDYCRLVEQGCKIEKNDVLIVKDGATTGRVGLMIDQTDCVALSSVAMLRPHDDVDSLFLMYYMESYPMQTQITNSMAGSAMPRITLTKLNEFVINVPPLREQIQIASFIDQKIEQTDNVLAEIMNEISDLKAYKSSLITEAVTGKIDLRNE